MQTYSIQTISDTPISKAKNDVELQAAEVVKFADSPSLLTRDLEPFPG